MIRKSNSKRTRKVSRIRKKSRKVSGKRRNSKRSRTMKGGEQDLDSIIQSLRSNASNLHELNIYNEYIGPYKIPNEQRLYIFPDIDKTSDILYKEEFKSNEKQNIIKN